VRQSLELVAEGEILIVVIVVAVLVIILRLVIITVLVVGRRSRCGCRRGSKGMRGGGRGLGGGRAGRDCRSGHGGTSGEGRDGGTTTNADNFTDVEVVALGMELRVVVVEEGDVDAVGGGNTLAAIIRTDDVGAGAVLTDEAQAELLARLEVAAVVVNCRVIGHSELVGGRIILCGDQVTVVALLDSVLARTVSSGDRGKGEGEKGGDDGGSEHGLFRMGDNAREQRSNEGECWTSE